MSDETYQPKTYRKDGGDTFVVASGGKILFETGGTMEIETELIITGDIVLTGDLTLTLEDIWLKDNKYLQFGDATGGDVSMRWLSASPILQILPVADDTGAINIGDGTTDIDFKVFLGTSGKYVDFNVGDSLMVISAGVQIDVDDTTAAESAATGSIHTAGGIGIAGALWVGTTSKLVGAVTMDGATSVAGLLTLSGNAGVSFTGGAVTKAINFASAVPGYASQEDAFIAIGTYTSAITIANTGAFSFIPIQVNLSSTGNLSAAGGQIAAARLRVDTDTNHQANTAISVLQIRSDLNKNCYSATGISGSTNISDDIALPTASLQGIYYQVTGPGAVTCPNEPNVMEIGYHQSSGGGGFNSVARFDVNANNCSITNILRLKNYAGTVTNAVSIEGAVNVGILFDALSALGIFMPAGSVTQAIKIGASNGDGSAPVVSTSTETTNIIEVNSELNAVSGILRGILSYAEFSGTNVGAGMNCYAIRGYGKVSGTIAGGSSVYVTGVQGKVEISGTMTGGRACGVLAQVGAKGSATVSGGEIAGLWIDNQFGVAVGGGNTLAMIHMETNDAAIGADSFLHVYGKASEFINFAGGYSDYITEDATAFASLTANFKVKVMVGATPCYIHMTTA